MAVQTVKATINGQEYVLTLNSGTGKYEATVTAPGTSSYNQTDGYYPVSVTATDDAGNTTTVDASDTALGASLRLVVKEKVAPTITVTAPTADAYITTNLPTITWTVTDDDSGVNPDTIVINVGGTAVATADIVKTPTAGGYECSYTPTAAMQDGTHTITFDASDNDGNAATQKTVSFTVDTVAPTLTVTTPLDGSVTSIAACNVTGTTNDATSSPVVLTVNGVTVQVGVDGSFAHAITLVEGVNTITVIATDAAGKATTVTRTVTLDTGAPTINAVTITPNPVDAGTTYIISVDVTDL